jgi:S-adenosyl-L-methionine hydrolase (adenosine-forming)
MTCIALLTDFGGEDWFVGTMKGVIASIAPKARIIDLCHDIPPGDIRAGAFSLLASFRYFPPGTVFVAVVDPGVGGPRAGLLAEAHGYHFIGPDNGILSYALGGGPPGTGGRASLSPAKAPVQDLPEPRIRGLENPEFRLPGSGSTFHGRDIFAPAAAHLLAGKPPAAFGKRRDDFVELPFPVPYKLRGSVSGTIVHVDRFGNAITNLTPRDLPEKTASRAKGLAIRAKGKAFPLAGFYAEAAPGKPLAVAGSCGFLELSVNGGNAARKFGLKRGDRVVVV